jgi:hypothetical protein
MTIESLLHETIEAGGDANEALELAPVHSDITEKCRNLAIFSSDLETFKSEFNSSAHFLSLSEFIVLDPSVQWAHLRKAVWHCSHVLNEPIQLQSRKEFVRCILRTLRLLF